MDIAFKMAARASVLLDMVGQEALKVFDDVTRLYGERSAIIHGGMVTPNFEDETARQRRELTGRVAQIPDEKLGKALELVARLGGNP